MPTDLAVRDDKRYLEPRNEPMYIVGEKWKYGWWPAGPGEQYEWEPPRIATGVKDRVSRLKCLGNAVCPQQIYPILKAIAEVEDGH
jgi:hypothetical protein